MGQSLPEVPGGGVWAAHVTGQLAAAAGHGVHTAPVCWAACQPLLGS